MLLYILTTLVIAVCLYIYKIYSSLPSKRKPIPVNVSCACGEVKATIQATCPMRLVCYCDDCQAYAQWIQQERQNTPHNNKSTSKLVDEFGGTYVMHVFKSELKITSGEENLKVVTKTRVRKMSLMRIYASCCGTPLFNTVPSGTLISPMVGVFWNSILEANCLRGEISRGSVFTKDVHPDFGPIYARIFSEKAKSPLPKEIQPIPNKSFGFSFLFGMLIRNLLNRSKSEPSPFNLTKVGLWQK